MPLVYICVPTYNAEKTLPETLDSILGQTYRNLTLLIVDNASTDNTLGIADTYASRDSRVRVYRHTENVGPEGNFTRCLQLAGGDYTAIFHSDDIYTPEMISEQVSFLEKHPQAGAVFTMAEYINAEGKPSRIFKLPDELVRAEASLYTFPEIFRAVLKYGNFFFCPSAMARTVVYRDQIKVWDAAGYRSSADLDVWFRILKSAPIGILPAPLLRYRGAAATSFSYTALRKKTAPHDMLKVLEAYSTGFAAEFMGPAERAALKLLILKDNVNRAFNIVSSGQRKEAFPLLRGLFETETLLYAVKSTIYLKVLAYGYAVFLYSFLPLPESVRSRIFKARHTS
ncbi:MAG: hypothetical protein A2016_11405 [Elusimicrobia bacterium GWF2_62_30]|nr:MAG: hypothetical protein A2016_11405 [Elusimicrobia bacterium GWF2_62_30]